MEVVPPFNETSILAAFLANIFIITRPPVWLRNSKHMSKLGLVKQLSKENPPSQLQLCWKKWMHGTVNGHIRGQLDRRWATVLACYLASPILPEGQHFKAAKARCPRMCPSAVGSLFQYFKGCSWPRNALAVAQNWSLSKNLLTNFFWIFSSSERVPNFKSKIAFLLEKNKFMSADGNSTFPPSEVAISRNALMYLLKRVKRVQDIATFDGPNVELRTPTFFGTFFGPLPRALGGWSVFCLNLTRPNVCIPF